MSTDRFTKVLLVLIIILLTALLIKPIFTPMETYATKVYQYKVVSGYEYDTSGELEDGLNKYTAEGWKLHSILPVRAGWIILER